MSWEGASPRVRAVMTAALGLFVVLAFTTLMYHLEQFSGDGIILSTLAFLGEGMLLSQLLHLALDRFPSPQSRIALDSISELVVAQYTTRCGDIARRVRQKRHGIASLCLFVLYAIECGTLFARLRFAGMIL